MNSKLVTIKGVMKSVCEYVHNMKMSKKEENATATKTREREKKYLTK